MNRFILLAFAIHLSSVATTIADDYLVRVDKIEYIDKSASEKAPKEKSLQSIEIIARPQSTFHSKVKIGMETLTLAGKLQPAENGGYIIQIQYRHIIDTGETFPTEDGKGKPRLNKTEFQTTLSITEGKSLTIGEIETNRSPQGKPEKTKIRYVLTVSKYKPAAD